MSCAPADEQPSLFTDIEAPIKQPGRRNPPRKAASRQRELQVHLPIVQGEAAELLRMEDLVVTQRPLTRGDCEEEARPCPWVSCPWHVYWGTRFEEFERIIDSIEYFVSADDAGGCTLVEAEGIGRDGSSGDVVDWGTSRAGCDHLEQVPCDDFPQRDPVEVAVVSALVRLFEQTEDDTEGRSRRPKTAEAVEAAARAGRAIYTVDKSRGKGGTIRSGVLSSTDVRGPWPTCMLDVAEDVRDGRGDLDAEDTARLLNVTREAVRLIETERARREFARSQELRPWLLEFVDEEQLDSYAELDWFGED